MDILHESKYNNVISKTYDQPGTFLHNIVDPNIISGYAKPVMPDYYEHDSDYLQKPMTPINYVNHPKPTITDYQHGVIKSVPPIDNHETTNINDNVPIKKQGFDIKEFIKKPDVLFIGTLLIAIILIKKII